MLVSKFDTSNVTDMNNMFGSCKSLTTLDLSKFDTSNVTNMNYMFSSCDSLTTLDLSKFDTSNVTNMNNMFYGCTSLTTLDVSGFNTGNVTNMFYMFYLCTSLTELELPTISVTSRNKFVPNAVWCNSNDYTTNVYDTLVGTAAVPAGTYVKCYSVTYKTNDGESDVVEYAKANSLLPKKKVTRTGYTLDGWYKNSGLTTAWNHDTDTVIANTTLYAKWKENEKYTISFDSNGGSEVESVTWTVDTVDTLNFPAEPTRNGFSFEGWSRYADSIDLVDAWDFPLHDTTTWEEIYSDTTLYAVWCPIFISGVYAFNNANNMGTFQHEILAESNAINLVELGPLVTPRLSNQFIVGDVVRYEAPSNHVGPGLDYELKGIYETENLGDKSTWTLLTTENTVDYTITYPFKNLVADYEVYYTVSFESNGGSEVESQRLKPLSCSDGTNCYVSEPTAPTKEGHTFVGWYEDSALTTEYEFWGQEPIDADKTLYAKWKANKYTVAFDSNEGSNVVSQTVEYNTVVVEPPVPTKEHYVFKGWFTDDTYATEWVFDTDLVKGPMTLYAKWEKEVYTVSFESNNGNVISNQEITYNEKVEEPTAPTKEHYIFKGWFTDNTYATEWVFDTDLVTEDITLYAKWEVIKYTVTFESNGGSTVSNQEIVEDGKVAKPADPVKDDYVFKGWYVDSNCVTPWNFDTDIVTGNITLYAKWVSACTVTFSNTGDSSVASQVVGYGDYAEEPTAPTKSYYEFAGWFTEMECTTEWDFANDKVTEDITLYAKWNPGKCKVYFNEGIYTDRVVDMQYVTINELVANPGDLVSTNDEYVFVGWYSGLTKWDFETDIVTCDMSLEAKWVHKSTTYTVKFVPINQFELDWFSIPDQIVNAGDYATKPVTPSKSVEFWFCSDNYYTEYAKVKMFDFETTPIIGDITLYYDSSAGLSVAYHDINETTREYEQIDSFYVKNNTLLEKPADPTSTIGEFVGWYLREPSSMADALNPTNAYRFWDFNTPVTAPTYLYAIYALKYNVTFDSNGGTDVASQSVFENSTVTEPTAPTKEHYVFKGWYTDNTYSTEWDFANDKVTEATILYAKWETEKYTVTFNSNGGSNVANQIVEYNTVATEPTVPTKEHYVFKGWYEDNAFNTEWVFDTDLVTENITLYAKWEKEVYTVSFESNGGSVVEKQNIAYQDKVVEPIAPTKAHYVFNGWFIDNTLNTEWVFDTDLVTEDITLYAKWEKEVYTISFESNGGSAVASQNITYQDKVTEPTAPTKAKAAFVGWYSDNTLTTPYDFDTKVESAITLYAKWINTYEVTFDVDGGSAVETQTVRENEKVKEPTAPTKATFYFVGWYTDNALTIEYDFETAVTSDFTLYAKWEGKLEHQKDVEQEAPVEFTWDDTVDEVKDAIKDEEDAAYDKTNNYWTAKMNVAPADVAALESTYNELQTAADTYEYAMAFDITIDKYISSDAEMTDIIERTNVTETKRPLVISFNAPELPTKKAIDEYTFYRVHEGVLEEIPVEYDRESNKFTFESDKFSEYAFYYEIADVYTVTFESNGGSEVGSQDVIDGRKATEPIEPTREGYTFMGWFSNTALTEGYDFESGVTADITLFAKWKKEVPTVQPTPQPEPTPGDEDPEEEDEEPSSEDEEPEPTPVPEPVPPVIPVIPTEPSSEDEDNDTDNVSTIPAKEEIAIVNNKVFTYVRTTEYGMLVNNRELKGFDIDLF